MSEIKITRNGLQYGPYTKEQILEHIGTGTVSINDLAWEPGATTWVPLRNLIGELPVTPSSKRRWLYVTLAVIPLLGNSFGLHNFYAKEYQKGLIRLGICLAIAILSVMISHGAEPSKYHWVLRIPASLSFAFAIYEAVVITKDGAGVPFK